MKNAIVFNDSRRVFRAIVLLAALVFGLQSSRAGLSEPEAMFYGSITISNQPVTTMNTDVVVEARRSPTGNAIASCRMGDNLGYGDFYALRIAVETTTPLVDTNAMTPGSPLYLVLSSSAGELMQKSATIGERGAIQRLDFAFANRPDTNALFTAWQSLYGIVDPNGDADTDGRSNLEEYLAGTDPTNTSSTFTINVSQTNQQSHVEFLARRCEGTGYDGMNRLYSLEYSTNLSAGWQGVDGYTNLLGTNQIVTCPVPTNAGGLFYRGKVWLATP